MIDLRSDTVTRPSPEMRKRMANAEVGDDVFGEDPTVKKLEETVADILGKESALYTPSGCMANQLALQIHTRPGDEVVLEADSHIFNYETTAASYLSRIQLMPVKGHNRGRLVWNEIEPAIREHAYYMPVTRLIALENTHNRAGGSVYSVEQIKDIRSKSKKQNIALHLDGARLWNACVAAGLEPKAYAENFDTVAVCFSKGLGAPVGSAIAGKKEMIKEAHRFRKIWGGGMRQAGILAAGALYALEHNRERLAEDHEKAKVFAEIIQAGSKKLRTDPETVETNIVLLTPLGAKQDPDTVLKKIREKGVALSRGAHGKLRAVTHLDVSLEDCRKAARWVVEAVG